MIYLKRKTPLKKTDTDNIKELNKKFEKQNEKIDILNNMLKDFIYDEDGE